MKTLKNKSPFPRLDEFLHRLVAPHLREEIMGDLHERYQRRTQRLGETNARQRYWRDARLTKIFEGTSEIQQRIISDHLLGKQKSA